MRIYWDLMGFHEDLMGFNGDLMVIEQLNGCEIR